MTDAAITKTVFLEASRETVWHFLTDRDKLAMWFHRADQDLRDGEDYALLGKTDDGADMKLCWGTVLEMDRPSRLVCSFTVQPLNGAMTTVTWTLDEVGDGTRLTLQHTGLAEVDAPFSLMMALDAGWDEHFGALRKAMKPQ
ncbi:SRPBCC family protein [Hoeflea poritis]|uniref:SRPBCC domain-containing protein n=1 Tax=Hoeflea poritis TaxID=2993659 RepID=A0ABT4VHQ5_9HYPH|nr:SRPBCC domain-containing protein [Hoeflea poritis]MDA4844206.1 SRPBCC domain-containing protein [Hoeflea poritis]